MSKKVGSDIEIARQAKMKPIREIAVKLAIPEDFVRTIMDSLGLGTREVGLNAMLTRVRRYAEEAARNN